MTKPNGQAQRASGVNGHALSTSSREARGTRLAPGRAASDDRRDLPNAAGAQAPAGMEHDGCAEVALPGEGPHLSGGSGKAAKRSSADLVLEPPASLVDIPPGIEPLPADGPGFVDAMHAHVDLYLACARLVKSADEKIAERMVERLLEMSYGKSPSQTTEDATPTTFGTPPPASD